MFMKGSITKNVLYVLFPPIISFLDFISCKIFPYKLFPYNLEFFHFLYHVAIAVLFILIIRHISTVPGYREQ